VIKSCDNLLPGLKRRFVGGGFVTGFFLADFELRSLRGALPPVVIALGARLVLAIML
jgi:hypothetical protein